MAAPLSHQISSRQLRAMILLLVLLPLVPASFVVRFLIEDLRTEHLEARSRSQDLYRKFLTDTQAPLVAAASREIPLLKKEGADPWEVFSEADMADTVLVIGPRGKLALPPISTSAAQPATAIEAARKKAAVTLASTLLDSGVQHISLARAARIRWRFFSETPEPLYAIALPIDSAAADAATVLLVASRRRLVDELGAYYRKRLDRQSALRVVDENGETSTLTTRVDIPDEPGEQLAEWTLPPPLPPWRLQLVTFDSVLVNGIMHEQIVAYAWLLGAVLALTGLVAAGAGWAISRRIALNEMTNDALTTVAHEMKTPLSSIRMLLETLLTNRYSGGASQVEEYLRLMAGENERLERLVGSFQMLGRLERSYGPGAGLRPTAVPAAEIIQSACTQVAPRLQSTQSQVRVSLGEPEPVFWVDREAFTAALVNLLDNAAKYSEPGCQITVRAFNGAADVVLEVEDQGVGIAPSERTKIFERFYQSDRRLARTHEGCGLGLSIVQSVVKLHEGKVTVRDAPAGGSIFSVRLPRPVDGARPGSPDQESGESGRRQDVVPGASQQSATGR